MVPFDLHFPKAYGTVLGSAIFKHVPSDFVVEEILPDALLPNDTTTGEHFYVQVTKTSTNTEWLAKQLAKIAGCSERDVGYCGLKDRHAITSQWFSFYLPKSEKHFRISLPEALSEQVIVHQQYWHSKKLRRGMHSANRFRIRLRNFDVDESILNDRLQQIQLKGVPNYFGAQRFGRNGNNLVMANQMWVEQQKISVRSQKNMAVSAARSYVFNEILRGRVDDETWADAIDGDCCDEIGLPTGPLWGRGRSATQAGAGDREAHRLAPLKPWLDGLEHCGLNQERRAFVLPVSELHYTYSEECLDLSFELAPGQYATSVLAEIADLQQQSEPVL